VFKVTIQNPEPIKEVLKKRIELLSEAMKNNDVTKLGRCRYFDAGCHFKDLGVCQCEALEPIPIKTWKNQVKMDIDEEFTKKLQSELDQSSVFPDTFSTKDIIAPRKYFMEKKLDIIESWTSNPTRESYNACMYNLVKSIPESRLNKEQYEIVKQSIVDKRINEALRWMNYKTSIKPDGELLPFLIKISEIQEAKHARPPQYAIAELAITCANYNKTRGIIFVVFPNLNDLVQVYEVNYKNLPQLQKIIYERIDSMVSALNSGNLLDMEACPAFFNKDSSCQLNTVCHATKSKGCL